LEGGGDCGGRRLSRKPSNLPDNGRFLSHDARRRRFTFDNGFPANDAVTDQRWPRDNPTPEHHNSTTNGNGITPVAANSQTIPITSSSINNHQSVKVIIVIKANSVYICSITILYVFGVTVFNRIVI